jgi:hypothetical protein
MQTDPKEIRLQRQRASILARLDKLTNTIQSSQTETCSCIHCHESRTWASTLNSLIQDLNLTFSGLKIPEPRNEADIEKSVTQTNQQTKTTQKTKLI